MNAKKCRFGLKEDKTTSKEDPRNMDIERLKIARDSFETEELRDGRRVLQSNDARWRVLSLLESILSSCQVLLPGRLEGQVNGLPDR